MASPSDTQLAQARELESALRSGDVARAIELAGRLAERRAPILLHVVDSPLSPPEKPISVKIFIEDRHISGVYVIWKLVPSTTLYALKRMVYEKFEFPLEVQRWIIRKRLVTDDSETLAHCRVTSDEPVYLYLVPARSCGVTKESAQITYAGTAAAVTPRLIPRSPSIPVNVAKPLTQNDLATEITEIVTTTPSVTSLHDDVDLVHRHDNVATSIVETGAAYSSADITDLQSGWMCPQCTCINEPTRPGCAACCTGRPADYQIPVDYVPSDAERKRLELERQLELQAASELAAQRIFNMEQLRSVDEQPLVVNTEPFQCPICFDDIPPSSGVLLRDCLHMFCIDCLCGHIQASTNATVACPFNDGNYVCQSLLLEREIRALVTPAIYARLLTLSVQEAESRESNSFHCVTADCPGWCIYEDDVNEFECPACGHANCLTCKAQHEGATCRQYQDSLRDRAAVDVAAQRTQRKIEKMLAKGTAMNCPTCKIVVMKKDGCHWICCTMCKTEICWVTRGPRWGPDGEGDESGGCHCGRDGKLCHPNCQNCH